MLSTKGWDYTYEKYRHLVFKNDSSQDIFNTSDFYNFISGRVHLLSWSVQYFDSNRIFYGLYGMDAYEAHACLDYMKENGSILEITPEGKYPRVFTSASYDWNIKYSEKNKINDHEKELT